MNLDHDVRWVETRFHSPTSMIDPAASHLPCADTRADRALPDADHPLLGASLANARTRGRVAREYRIAGSGGALGLGSERAGAKSYPSARITRVSGWTPSCFIASAAGSVCMNS
jgi:hypothetical protein